MKNIKLSRLLGGTALIVVFAIIGLFIWSLTEADANTRSAIIAAIGLIVTVLIANSQTKKREIAAHHFSDKRNGYMNYVDIFIDLGRSEIEGKKCDSSERISDAPGNDQKSHILEDRVLEFKKTLLIWGSTELIETWNVVMNKIDTVDSNEDRLDMLDDVLRAIRKDLGHNDFGLQRGKLVSLLIKREENDTSNSGD